MPRKKLPAITDDQWQAAVDAYELGHASGRQIARDLGVSPATVCRRMRHLGAVKGCRLEDAMAPIIAELDRRAVERLEREAAAWDQALARSRAISALMHSMIGAIFAADRAGSMTLAAGPIARTKEAIAAH